MQVDHAVPLGWRVRRLWHGVHSTGMFSGSLSAKKKALSGPIQVDLEWPCECCPVLECRPEEDRNFVPSRPLDDLPVRDLRVEQAARRIATPPAR